MQPQSLTLRQLNRRLLARQFLLRRERLSCVEAIQALAGMQSQIPNPPYIGLWTRLQDFAKPQLTTALSMRTVVRAPWIRSTLHLVAAEDHQRFQALIQPALARGLRSFFGARAKGLDIEGLIEIAKPFLESDQPAIGALRDKLQEYDPAADKQALAYAVRSYLPLVQVPPSGTWGVGTRATYTTAESWLGLAAPADLESLFRRYLAAFGPADVMDFQTWAGMTSLKSQLQETLSALVAYRDEGGRVLYDLPDQPLVAEDCPAPIRFLPEYDNILIAHKDRRRILPEAQRKKVFISAGRVLGTVLIDGFVAAIWKAERGKKTTTLRVTLFNKQPEDILESIEAEGLALARFIDDGAAQHQVEFASQA